MDEPLSLGPLVRRYRLAAGLSQEELAEQSGLSARAVSDMERGLRSAPRLESLRMLSDALGLDDSQRADLLNAARPDMLRTSASPSETIEPVRPFQRTTTLPLVLQPLPRPLTKLIGRERELDLLRGLCQSEESRLVSLVGPGGVGKTRLCLEVAHHLAPSFSDGIAFVDLSALLRAELIPSTIADAMGVVTEAGRSPLNSLRTALQQRSLLLILDNVEHLLEGAPVVSDLLVSCPELSVLVTSRVRLHLRGEHVVTIGPLEVGVASTNQEPRTAAQLRESPAVQLFLERASENQSGFRGDDQNLATISQICQKLDGLPLAIELAASRIRVYTPEALLERLEYRLPALTGGPRDAPERQRTLAWSYDLLDTTTQQVFRRLAAFSGGFTLDAAQQVAANPGDDAATMIEELVDHSLLRPGLAAKGTARFSMLETVREFAETAFVASDEVDDIRRRHAEWCNRMVERAGSEIDANVNVRYWYDAMDAELPNIRSALEYMLSSGDASGAVQVLTSAMFYWPDRPYFLDLRRWLHAAIDLAPNEKSANAVRLHGMLAYIAAALSEPGAASVHISRTKEIAETVSDPLTQFNSLNYEAVVMEFAGDIARAAELYESGLTYALELKRFHDIQSCMAEMADKWVLLGDVRRAIPTLDQALAMAREAGASTLVSHTLIHRAYAALAEGDSASASAFLTESLELAQTFSLYRDALGAIAGLAGVAANIGDPETAARLFGAIEAAARSIGIHRIFDLPHAERIEETTRAALGSGAFDKLRQEGATMTFEDAVALARAIAAAAMS